MTLKKKISLFSYSIHLLWKPAEIAEEYDISPLSLISLSRKKGGTAAALASSMVGFFSAYLHAPVSVV